MRFVAALDTRFYDIPYVQGAEVDTVAWTRKMLLKHLGNGLIQAAALTAGAITDSLVFEGPGVSTDVDDDSGVMTVTINPPAPVLDLDDLTDVDLTVAPTDGQALKFDLASSKWKAGTVSGGGGGGSSSGFNVFFAHTSTDLASGTVPTSPTGVAGMSLAIPGSALPRTALVDFDVMFVGAHTNRFYVAVDGIVVTEPILGTLAGGNNTYAAVGAGIPVVLSAGGSHSIDIYWTASDSTAAVTLSHRALTAQVFDGATSPLGGTAGAPVGPAVATDTQNDRRWYVPAGITSIDEFDDETINPAWVRVDAAGGSGRVVYAEGAGGLSVKNNGGDANSEMHALLRPLSAHGGPLVTGSALITCMTVFGSPSPPYVMGGFMLADGLVHGAGLQLISLNYLSGNTMTNDLRTFTNYGVQGTTSTGVPTPAGMRIFVRIVYLGSNTWRMDLSMDGVLWMSDVNFARTFTPTHVGFMSSSWATSTKGIVRYEFLRRQEGVT